MTTKSIQLPSESMRDSVKDWMTMAIMRTAGMTSSRLSSMCATATLMSRYVVHTTAKEMMSSPMTPVSRAAST